MDLSGSRHTFVLVPGSWHGAWCWYKIVPLLRREGFEVLPLDLPGHGRDHTPLEEITLDGYVDAVCRVLDREPGKVTLVGHSRGGIVISQVAERCPEKIETLVYLAAFLIKDGEPMIHTALADKDSLIVQNLELNEQEGWHMLRESAFKSALYGDCTEEDVELARSLLTREPNAPVGTPLHLTQDRFGRVPRVYIETLSDRGISNPVQRKMYTDLPCEEVIAMNTSHSPFLSAPEELASHLISISRRR
ncbi:MAG: alpha/beta fold hydrolase [Thaumarchaeota archaeon]|nr:alpha/beta fold hydrolase [Nitrososphaerota archaeon]